MTPEDQLEMAILNIIDLDNSLIGSQSAGSSNILSRVREFNFECSLGLRLVFPDKLVWQH